MTQTISIIRFLLPFLLTGLFFRFYRKDDRPMRQFMWSMTLFPNARRLYARILLMLLILTNWCCHVTEPNLSVALSSVLTLSLFWTKVADRTLHRLHESMRLWTVTLLLAMACCAIPYLNSMFLLLFIVSLAAVFYPSEKVIRMTDVPKERHDLRNMTALISRHYY